MSDMRIIGIRPLPKPEKRPSRCSALILWAIAASGLVVSALLSSWFYPVLEGMGAYGQLLIANLLYYLPFVVLPVFLLARRTPELFEAYRPNPISLFNVISIVILAVLGVFFVNDLTVLWSIPFEELGWNIHSAGIPAAQNARELMLSVVVIAVIPAVCEEFLFRGVVLSAFEGHGTKHAAWVSAILFMLIHGTFFGAPTQLILGIVLAMLVFWSDSIYAGVIYHTVHNAAAVVLTYLQGRMAAEESIAEGTTLLQAIGGMTGILDLLFNIALSAMLILFTLRLFRLRGQLRGITAEVRRKEALGRREWIPLILGALSCLALYVLDFTVILGG